MLHTLLAVVVFWAGVGCAYETCRANDGRWFWTFSMDSIFVTFPCKYNAIRNTVCGDWKILVTPSAALDPVHRKYYTKGLWVGVENIHTNKEWQGRTSIPMARGYIKGKRTEPFRKKDGILATGDVFKFEKGDNSVSLIEQSGQFRIDFSLKEDDNYKNSGFAFQCHDPNFKPTPYPTQLCGNGTARELVLHTLQEHAFGFAFNSPLGNSAATLFYYVFTDPSLEQVNSDCASSARIMTWRCKGEGYKAAERCWDILGIESYYGHIGNPMSAFKHCVEFVCSGYKDPNSCIALRDELEGALSQHPVSNYFPGACG